MKNYKRLWLQISKENKNSINFFSYNNDICIIRRGN